MNSKVSYVAVGLFVLALGAALIAGILWISTGGPRQSYDSYVAYMTDSVSGVSRDGAVKYRGVDVGKVTELVLDPDNPERVRVLLKIEQGTPIKEDTFATLEMQGLTGLAYISLVGGSKESPPLRVKNGQAYPEIPSKPSRLEELSTTVFNLLAALTETSSRLSALLSETNNGNLGKTLGNLETFTNTLVGQSANVTTALEDFSAAMHSTRQAMTHLPALVAHIDQTATAMEGMVDEIVGASIKVSEAGAIVAEVGANLNQTIAGSGQRVDQFTRDVLPEADLLVNDLRQAARNLRRLIEQLGANPGMLLHGAPQSRPGPGE
ncbi:MCE family protein [bacterium AH-315-E07]|nr:MCE family protein [bacterium AH-315-E07]